MNRPHAAAVGPKRLQIGCRRRREFRSHFAGDEIEVIGSKGALVADLEASSVDKSRIEFNLKNAKISYLDQGDCFNLKTKVVTPSARKLRR